MVAAGGNKFSLRLFFQSVRGILDSKLRLKSSNPELA
jgi:hypothetical protein